jgi:hypothetical protein
MRRLILAKAQRRKVAPFNSQRSSVCRGLTGDTLGRNGGAILFNRDKLKFVGHWLAELN